MRRLLVVACALVLALGAAPPAAGRKPPGNTGTNHAAPPGPRVHVRGYTRKDGTYVAPHDRAYPGSGTHPDTPKSLNTSPHVTLPAAPGGPGERMAAPHSIGLHAAPGLQRDSHGKIKRSEGAKNSFKRLHPCPATGRNSGPCPGYVIDHIVPLCASGPDAAYNMQWQTITQGKEKDRLEKTQCNAFPHR